MLVCNLLHGCRVTLAWRWGKKENGKRFCFSFIICLFVLKWICSPLLRVTTNHLYSLGKCRFTWRLMILCACSDCSSCVPASFPRRDTGLWKWLLTSSVDCWESIKMERNCWSFSVMFIVFAQVYLTWFLKIVLYAF